MKECCHCKTEKPITQFGSDRGKSDGKAVTCNECRKIQRKKHRDVNPEKYDAPKKVYRKNNLNKYAGYRYVWRHGISKEETKKILEDQGGCKICFAQEPGGKGEWHLDHNHNCCPRGFSCENCRRGVLCNNCNLMLGLAKDNAETLLKAVEYLADFERKQNAHV